MNAPAYVVNGADPVLRDEALNRLIADLVGADDRSLVVEDLTVPGHTAAGEGESDVPAGAEGREHVVSAALNALQSPPFMTASRIVVLHEAGNLTKDELPGLLGYLENPMDTSTLVLVAGGGRLPADLVKALRATKAIEVSPETERTGDVLSQHLEEAGVKLRPDAAKVVTTHLGEDAGRVPQLVELLAATFGPGVTLDVDDVQPYLGEAGSVPGYQLTNAIEAGDVAGALEVLHRMLNATGPSQPRPMHPLQIIGLLHSYYRRLLRLDDPAVHNVPDAIEALGGRVKEYPARKALGQARALRSDGLRAAYKYLFTADLELKGARALPEEAVLEVLVARLAALSGRERRGPRDRARAAR